MTEPSLPTRKNRQKLTPTQVVTSGATRREYEWQFANVDIDGVSRNLDLIFTGNSMKAGAERGYFWYQYGEDGYPIFCSGSKVFCSEEADTMDAAQDAYFMLSMCDEHGYVSRWRKR